MESDEEADEELRNPDLYIESMIEIESNEEAGKIGHDTDPFDRSGEYDEDVDLNAPVAPTPDIPTHTISNPSTLPIVDVEELQREIERTGDRLAAYQKMFAIEAMEWRRWISLICPHLVEKCSDDLNRDGEAFGRNVVEVVDASQNHDLHVKVFEQLKSEDLLDVRNIVEGYEMNLLRNEMNNGEKRDAPPIFGDLSVKIAVDFYENVVNFANKNDVERDRSKLVTRYFAMIVETRLWMRDPDIDEILEKLRKHQGFQILKAKRRLPLEWME